MCNGRGEVQSVQRSFLGQVMTARPCPQCQGFGTLIPHPCPECSGEGRVRTRRTITVKIPPGVDTGTRIQLSGEGEVGPGAGPAGDLFLEIVETPHEVFSRQGDDLHCTITLPMTAAALGTSIDLETLDVKRGPQGLAGGKNSRLYKRLVYELQVAQDVTARFAMLFGLLVTPALIASAPVRAVKTSFARAPRTTIVTTGVIVVWFVRVIVQRWSTARFLGRGNYVAADGSLANARVLAGGTATGIPISKWVFANSDGEPVHPQAFSQAFDRVVEIGRASCRERVSSPV